jgi:hypothetical protein
MVESLPPIGPQSPFCLEVLQRLPLAEAFYRLWAFVASDDLLADLFDRFRGRCYQDRLTFPDLVHVLADAITRHRGSGHAALTDALDGQRLPCQPRAVYAKLGRVPLPLAEALLATLTARLRPLFPPRLFRNHLPPCLEKLAVVVLDGKKIKKVAKRLLATRGRPGKLYGGKILAAYLPADGFVPAFAAEADGEANDVRLVPAVVPLVRAVVAGPRLWVADSQFCDLDQPGQFGQDDDHFLVRFTRRNSFTVDPSRPARSGQSRTGQAYVQEWGWMGSVADERRRYLRRLTLQRPGEEPVVLVTDLLDADAYPAEELLEVYLLRWQIENVFQEITEVFELRQLIGCTPQATVVQAAVCLLIYNMVQLLRGYAVGGRPQPLPVSSVSSEKLFEALRKQLTSLHTVLGVSELLEALAARPAEPAELQGQLTELLAAAWSERWRKAKAKKRRPVQPKAKQSGAHTSVQKILVEAKQQKDNTERRRRQ